MMLARVACKEELAGVFTGGSNSSQVQLDH